MNEWRSRAKAARLSQKAIARIIGITEHSVSRSLSSERPNPAIKLTIVLAERLPPDKFRDICQAIR